jgi:small neutral amino acid transporter SnatA (MarC family)
MGILDYLQHKISSAIGGLLGGTSALRFFHAKTPKDAFYRGALSIIFSVVFGIPVLAYFGLPYQNWEWQLASGFVCGFIGYSLMSYASKVIKEKEESTIDILSIHSEIKTEPLAKLPSKKMKPKSKKRKK